MINYQTRKALIKNVSVESITVYVEQDAVIGVQLSIHTDPDHCRFYPEAIQHQIKTTQEVKALLERCLVESQILALLS